ncbi:sensor domain-containing diguanylate cyclase [Shewanella gaetbuli]
MLIQVSFVSVAEPVDLSRLSHGSMGKHIEYFRERDGKISLQQARQKFQTEELTKGTSHSISLGIGVDPVWMTFSINNTTAEALLYRLSVETPWIDYIDTWLIHNGEVLTHVKGGDGVAFAKRPMQYRYYAFEHAYPVGVTQVIMRVETKGPMALPVQFNSVEKAISRDIASGYQFGALYGIMVALALYNLVLFAFIRRREYGLYGLYLVGFVLNSLSYTGQLHTIFTADFGPYFQDWVDIFLMITYSVAGLHFGRSLLQTIDYAPKLDAFIVRTTIYIPLGMLIGLVFNQLLFAMALSFLLNSCFVLLFIAMGVKALYAKKPFAMIFILSSVTAAICITVSTLAVAGILVPYNDYTFKAIEVGMAFEAILLASILARQFRVAQLEKVVAEKFAHTDPLTQLNNRRGFYGSTKSTRQQIVRNGRDISVVLIDLDAFKSVNDIYGHSKGDEVLESVAQAIVQTCRKGDISARWGGEEFIIFLPETSQKSAMIQAERLRAAIEAIDLTAQGEALTITASIGVAGSTDGQYCNEPLSLNSFETMINAADKALYEAKNSGKNQVIEQTAITDFSI